MSDIILHHYPQSPVSEKVRIVLGLKGLAWRSVEIPRLPPKPDLMPLTGGYRLTPVMQIGADIYCDSKRILREIDRRHPEPTLFPGGAQGMAWGIGQWTDGPMFRNVIATVFGANADELPPEFYADRIPLYFGPDVTKESMIDEVGHNRDQLRVQFGWMDDRLSGGRDFMLGAEPGLPDAFCYYLVWFLRGRDPGGPGLLARFPHLLAWEARMKAFGHGRPEPMDSKEALDIAEVSQSIAEERADPDDPRGLKPGDVVEIAPVDPGGGAVRGTIVASSAQEIAIRHSDRRVGAVVVHFARAGYRVTPL